MTELDQAHAAMEASGEDAALRLQFFERLADTELFLLLKSEAESPRINPRVVEVEGHQFVLVFDLPDRLRDFTEGEAPFVALSGRAISEMLTGQGIGLAVNLGSPSAILLDSEAIDWLNETLAQKPQSADSKIRSIRPPRSVPPELLKGLDRKLALCEGRARYAYLVDVEYESGEPATMLVFIDAYHGAQVALGQAVSDALVFSGVPAGTIDVAFVARNDPLAPKLAKHGLRFDIPTPPELEERRAAAPGSDPDKPPILK